MATLVPEQTRVILRVNEVETTTQIAHCEDKTGGVFKAQFGDNYGVLLVPEPGELWSATRVGFIWKLVSRIDTTVGLQPGDGLINLSGAFKLNATSVSINGRPLTSVNQILGTANRISVLNGDGLAGDPTIDISASYVGQASITTLGTITTGIWNASTITASKIDAAIARLASPTFTGTPAAPTAAVDTNTTQIATTAFVIGQGYAKLVSPALTGTPTAPTAAVDTNTTQLATTAFVLGQVGTTTPLIDGTATVGTSLRYSRQDHIHPTDTTRAALASPTFTGTPAAPTAAVDTNTTQVATTAFVIGQGYFKQGDWWFGDGSDGDVTISTTVTLTHDMHYHNLTLTAGAALIPNGWRVFVSGTLDLTNAPAGAIRLNGANANSPTGGNQQTAGVASGSNVGNNDVCATMQIASQIGNNGSTSSASASAGGLAFLSGISQTAGSGGGGGPGGAGGAVGSNGGITAMQPLVIRQPRMGIPGFPSGGPQVPYGTNGARGGGDGTNSGGASGGPGGAAGMLWIAARTISRGGSTAAACIQVNAGSSGVGGSPVTGNCGGGGGAGGSSGGYIHLLYLTLSGSVATGCLQANGAAGGTGGTACGTGTSGHGGSGGSGGIIDLYNLQTGILLKTYGSGGGGFTGTTVGGSAGTCNVDL